MHSFYLIRLGDLILIRPPLSLSSSLSGQSCRHSIQSATLQVGGSNVAAAQSWTSQYMDTSYYNPNYGGIQFVMKLTGLGMDSITANGAQICMTLNSECPTLQVRGFAFCCRNPPRVLEKRDSFCFTLGHVLASFTPFSFTLSLLCTISNLCSFFPSNCILPDVSLIPLSLPSHRPIPSTPRDSNTCSTT